MHIPACLRELHLVSEEPEKKLSFGSAQTEGDGNEKQRPLKTNKLVKQDDDDDDEKPKSQSIALAVEEIGSEITNLAVCYLL